MRWNVVELATNGRYAKLFRGFLVVMEGDHELGRVIIDEMNCLLLTAEQATLSKPVMVRLAEHGVPVVVCGTNYHPVAICLPYGSHHQAARILHEQISASSPLKKRLWQAIVKMKIARQSEVLINCRPEQVVLTKQIARMVDKVRSGDPDNVEAQAARAYWQALMGQQFRRQPEGDDNVNAALNYGYTIMRAACARAIMAAGLTPALGLHHRNRGNPFCLADDLMEVYRPLVDQTVFFLDLESEFGSEHKRQLSQLLQADVIVGGQSTTINTSMQLFATSVVNCFESKSVDLHMPSLKAKRKA